MRSPRPHRVAFGEYPRYPDPPIPVRLLFDGDRLVRLNEAALPISAGEELHDIHLVRCVTRERKALRLRNSRLRLCFAWQSNVELGTDILRRHYLDFSAVSSNDFARDVQAQTQVRPARLVFGLH